MPGFHIHVAVGNRFKSKNKIHNELDFFKGVVLPDLTTNKDVTHYTGYQDKNNLLEYLENKVNLYEFLKSNNISGSKNKGIFLHLVTDYLFFNYFLDKDYLKNISYDDFCKDLYYSYDVTNDYIYDKYNVVFDAYKDEIMDAIKESHIQKKMDDKKYLNILPLDKLDSFIELVSSIDLDKYADKIKKMGKNILPDEMEE